MRDRSPPTRIAALAATLRAGMAAALAICAAAPVRAGDTAAARLIPAAVFGTDDRGPLPAKYKALQESLGLFFNPRSRSICSGFCVADNVVATAGHCLFRTAGEAQPRLSDFWFARNYDTLRDYARIAGFNSGASGQNVLVGSTRLKVSPPIDATSDWALVRLSRPICARRGIAVSDLTVPEAIRQAAAGRVFQLSYHRDFTQWRPAYSKPCKVARDFATADWRTIAADFSSPERLLLHTCDTGGASSGSPLLLETSAGVSVIGINVGTYLQARVTQDSEAVRKTLTSDTVANTGVAAGAFADRIAAFSTANLLATAGQIRDLQDRLRKRGHYRGAVDGTFGPDLRAAIEAYQTAAGSAVTGIASDELLRALGAAR